MLAGKVPQPRHRARVDLDEALEEAGPLLELWNLARMFPEAPLYGGGLMDWPNVAVEALSICRAEAGAISAYLQHQAQTRTEQERLRKSRGPR